MRAAVGVVIELPQMHKLIDRASIALKVADQLLVLPALLKGRKAEFLIELHGLRHRANAECVGSQLVECHRKFLLESGLTISGVPGGVLEDIRFAIDGKEPAPSSEWVSWNDPTRRQTNSPARQMPS